MAEKNWHAGSALPIAVQAVVCLAAAVAPARAFALSDSFAPPSYLGELDPNVIWEALIAGVVICSFLIAIALWIHSSLRRTRRLQLRRNAFVSSAMNNLNQGVVMTDAQRRVIFCNDRYIEIYGLARSDLWANMNGYELLELRRKRGVLGAASNDEFYEKAASTNGLITELPDGRAILVKYFVLPNGGSVTTHLDVSEDRRLSRQLASTKQCLETVLDNVPACVAAKNIEDGRYIFANSAGERRMVASIRIVVRNESNKPEFLMLVFEDITDRRSLSKELESTKKFLELVVDNIPVALIVEQVKDGRYLLANRSAETILNRRREEATIKKRGMITEEHPISTKDGLRLFLTRRATVLNDAGEPQYLIKTHEDVTDRRQTESRMAHMAYHDGLTDLPNRAAFLQALTQMIEACEGTNEEFAVLCVDLDGLKEVNDVFGHALGDKLLIEVAQRLQDSARGGVVARLSGDEFGLIIDGKQPEAGLALAQQIGDAVAQEFQIDGRAVRAGVTTGMSIFPHNGADGASLLANAGAALFRAKQKSRGTIGLYQPEMDQQIRDRRVLHQDLSKAIKNGELSLAFQPQGIARHSVAESEIIGFEALARWQHPVRGQVSPAEFIPIAEESGLIVGMGEWILREACREAASWPKPLQVAVNLSPAQFMHGDVVGLVHSILIETGLAPGRLELEITEGVLIEDFDRGLALLRRLKALGVRISMDDFGSGYSSLSYLQAFPFDKIKIDRAFVINLGKTPQSANIVSAVIDLGHGLEMSIVAEGVETAEQLAFLAQEGCDAVQGYLLGKPAPIGQYATLVGRNPANAMEPARKTG